jgi:hypothetical protein
MAFRPGQSQHITICALEAIRHLGSIDLSFMGMRSNPWSTVFACTARPLGPGVATSGGPAPWNYQFFRRSIYENLNSDRRIPNVWERDYPSLSLFRFSLIISRLTSPVNSTSSIWIATIMIIDPLSPIVPHDCARVVSLL